ncbi:MAG: hypothetical protein FWD51_02240 [Betaproteobacteria bacterium]|nr:hypothetical protein [Betaproteobacteria bacterium]
MAQSWQQTLRDFRYIPVVSDTCPDDGWTGRRGLVHEAVLADFADLSQHEVYVCGAPPMRFTPTPLPLPPRRLQRIER